MSDSNKTKWGLVMLAMIILLAFPIILNWLILRPAVVEVVGEGADWLGFWAAYIGAIASFAMVVLTWWTLKQSKIQNDALIAQNEEILQNNKEQLDELKRQWEEENRPYLEVSIVKSAYVPERYELEFKNIGRSSAESVNFRFDDGFLTFLADEYREYFLNISTNNFKILPSEIKRLRLLDNTCISCYDYMVGNKKANRELCGTVFTFLKTTGVTLSVSYNGIYSLTENLLLDEHKTQTLTMLDAVTGVSTQLANIRMDHKPKEETTR